MGTIALSTRGSRPLVDHVPLRLLGEARFGFGGLPSLKRAAGLTSSAL